MGCAEQCRIFILGFVFNSLQQSVQVLNHVYIPLFPDGAGYLDTQGVKIRGQRPTFFIHARTDSGKPTEGGEYDFSW